MRSCVVHVVYCCEAFLLESGRERVWSWVELKFSSGGGYGLIHLTLRLSLVHIVTELQCYVSCTSLLS